jgi:hypothetical protein
MIAKPLIGLGQVKFFQDLLYDFIFHTLCFGIQDPSLAQQ